MQQTSTITLTLPLKINEEDAKMMILSSLFGKGDISSGKAAELLNISRIAFLESVGEYGISIFSDDKESLSNALNISI
jgi:predicted HTH domain antitoxin